MKSTWMIAFTFVVVAVVTGQIGFAQETKPPPADDEGFVSGPLASAKRNVRNAEENLQRAQEDLIPKAEAFRRADDELRDAPAARKGEYMQIWKERASEVTEATLREVEASKQLNGALRGLAEVQAQAPPSVSDDLLRPEEELPAPNALGNLQDDLGDDYDRAVAINGVLQSGEGLEPLPLEQLEYVVQPALVIDPFEVVLDEYQEMYDSIPPAALPGEIDGARPAKPGPVPPVGPAGPVEPQLPPTPEPTPQPLPPIQIAGSTWRSDANGATYEFLAGGGLVETAPDGSSYSGSWKRSGNTATGTWQKTYGRATLRHEYQFEFQGDRATVTIRRAWTPSVDTPPSTETLELRRTSP